MKVGSKMDAIIVAAGASQRMGDTNKLLAPLGDKPLLAWSVDACHECGLIRRIVLVLNDRDLRWGRELKDRRLWTKVIICSGGARRQDSVREGLKQIEDSDMVMIHDGARPFLTPDLVEKGYRLASQTGSAVAAVPVKDTIKLVGEDMVIGKTLERNNLWAAQTPQVFSRDTIARAYARLTEEVTDDGAAVELLGCEVHLYMGDHNNIKVTTPADLSLARIIAEGLS